MDTKTIQTIEAILDRGERVELTKDKFGAVKILRIRREVVSAGGRNGKK